MNESLESVVNRVLASRHDESDLLAIASAIHDGQIILTSGSGSIGIGGDVVNSPTVSGSCNVIGSNNIVIQGESAMLVQALLSQQVELVHTPAISLDDLVQQVRSRIHDDIQRLHGTMPLWGVDHWVPLGELFVDVNILEEVSSNRRSELADLVQDFNRNPGYRSLDRIGLGQERERVSGLEVLDRNTNLIVVGKPGSGKTTYLQRVVTECNAGNLQAHRIPVLIRLREFVEDGRGVNYALERYLERCWRLSATEVQLVLEAGRSLLLLDGLDEVTGDDGKAIAKQIKRFARVYPQVQVIVTCRTQSQESQFERFDAVEVADFNEPQVRAFAEHWFQTVCGDLTVGQAKATAFLEQLFREENKPIRELAILLSLTCAVFQQKQAFYSKRSKLYEEGLELLLEQWDKSREIERDEIYRDLSVERKLELLSYLAMKKFEQEQYVLFEQAEIEGYIAEFLGIGVRESRGVLRAIESQHGLLIERSQKVWSFSHLTLQEYLTAKWVCDQDTWNTIISHIVEPRWQQIFFLIANILKNSDFFMADTKKYIDSMLSSDVELQTLFEWIYQRYLSSESLSKSIKNSYHEFDLKFLQQRFMTIGCSLCLLQSLSTSKNDFSFDSVFPSSFSAEPLRSLAQISRELWSFGSIDFSYEFNFIIGKLDKVESGKFHFFFLERLDILAIAQNGHKLIFFNIKNIENSFLKHNWYGVYPESCLSAFSTGLMGQVDDWLDRFIALPDWKDRLKEDILRIANGCSKLEIVFGRKKEDLLKQLYDASIILNECISLSSSTTNIQENIKKELLLPIAEIEKRNREKAEQSNLTSPPI